MWFCDCDTLASPLQELLVHRAMDGWDAVPIELVERGLWELVVWFALKALTIHSPP